MFTKRSMTEAPPLRIASSALFSSLSSFIYPYYPTYYSY